MPVSNKGRLIQFINGITGVIPGGQAVVNLPVSQRYHRLVFQCTANNYRGGTSLPIVAITGTGTGATITPTIVNGTVTGGTITAGGSGWNVGDTFTFTDSTGTGFVGTVATVTGGPPGALTTFTVTVGAQPSAIDPRSFFTSFIQKVNGIIMRDIDVADTLRMVFANGQFPRRGEFPVYYTEPWRNIAYLPEAQSWDLYGQSTFQIQFGIASGLVNPGLSGVMEFDYFRNEIPGQNGAMVPFLQPISHHSYAWPIVAGQNNINTLPFNFPILRLWVRGSVPGAITQLDIFQDANKPLETLSIQNLEGYEEYGIQFGKPNYVNQTWATSTSEVSKQLAEPAYFENGFISDPDYDFAKALRVENAFIARIYSSVPQTAYFTLEALPGKYA